MPKEKQDKPVISNMEPMFYVGTIPGHIIGKSGQVPYQMLTHFISVPLRATLLIEGEHSIGKEELPSGKYMILKKEYYDELMNNQQKGGN